MTRLGRFARLRTAGIWTIGHAARIWPFAMCGIVLALSWDTLRHVDTRHVRAAFHALDWRWLAAAAAATSVNVAVMGLYDVLAFRHTRTRPIERWRYGAVAFAWSNFLTLGPLAGPAIRFWLYKRSVETTAELHAGVLSVAVAFSSGLAGWTLAVLLVAATGGGVLALALSALALVAGCAWIGGLLTRRLARFASVASSPSHVLELAVVGWLDWLLAAIVFVACTRATGSAGPMSAVVQPFFLGQVIGLASLVPGGFGSSDAFWIAHLPVGGSVAAAALMAYRAIYYIAPWSIASLVLLTWATRQSSRRVDVARRIVAGLVGGAGVLIVLSSASPALHARLLLLQQYMPLPLVEAGHLTAALAGLLLLVLSRGLVRGYRAAFRATLTLLLLAAAGSMLKGLDWEESLLLAVVAAAVWMQSTLFDRPSHGDWLSGPDLVLALAALALFVTFGIVSHHLHPEALHRWTAMGYRLEGARFVRTAGSMALAIAVAALYLLIRIPVRFEKPGEEAIAGALAFNARFGHGTTPLMVATGDKAVFSDGERGFCLYRTIGPYLVVFSDPVVRSVTERAAFLDALFAFAAELDRRPLFYQVSLDWIPLLHDRGYNLFKLGEEAHVPLDRITMEGRAGKMTRQFLKRAERDGAAFRILEPHEVAARLPELFEVSEDWLRAKGVAERQFSIGSFDAAYLSRFRCAVVEAREGGRILAFANLLEGPNREELSVDLMRARSDGPRVMDFLLTALFLDGQRAGYRRFNLGMAPLASVGEQRGAHVRERVAHLIFQRGEPWYNFQGVRSYKQKFDPEWTPRYMAYERAWEWPVASASVSALIAGGWGSALRPARDRSRAVSDSLAEHISPLRQT